MVFIAITQRAFKSMVYRSAQMMNAGATSEKCEMENPWATENCALDDTAQSKVHFDASAMLIDRRTCPSYLKALCGCVGKLHIIYSVG